MEELTNGICHSNPDDVPREPEIKLSRLPDLTSFLKDRMSRRDLLKAGVLTGMSLSALRALARAPAAAAAPAPTPTFDWKRFKGESIFVLFNKHPQAEVIEKNIPEFVELTGIKVTYEDIPEIQARMKLTVELTAKSPSIDAFWTALHVEKRMFHRTGWYTPLNDLLKDPTLTSPDLDWKDFGGAGVQMVTQPDGTISAIPLNVDPHILWWNKEILGKKGFNAPPKTLAEMEQIAKAVHNPPQVYGFVARGLKYANTPIWGYYLYNYGGDWMDKDRKPTLNSPEAVESLAYYVRMLRTYGPPGVVGFNWYECSAPFMAGQVAMYTDGIGFSEQFEDKTKSKVVGKTGYAPLPAGPGAATTGVFGSAMAVGPFTKKKGPGWFFCQWANSKENHLRAAQAGVGAARLSVYDDPRFRAQTKMPPDWVEAFKDGVKRGRLGLPDIVAVAEFRDLVGIAIVEAIEGKDGKTVLDRANKEFVELLAKTER